MVCQMGLVGATQVQFSTQCGEGFGTKRQTIYLVVFRLQWKLRSRHLHAKGSVPLNLNCRDMDVVLQRNRALGGKYFVIGKVLQGRL